MEPIPLPPPTSTPRVGRTPAKKVPVKKVPIKKPTAKKGPRNVTFAPQVPASPRAPGEPSSPKPSSPKPSSPEAKKFTGFTSKQLANASVDLSKLVGTQYAEPSKTFLGQQFLKLHKDEPEYKKLYESSALTREFTDNPETMLQDVYGLTRNEKYDQDTLVAVRRFSGEWTYGIVLSSYFNDKGEKWLSDVQVTLPNKFGTIITEREIPTSHLIRLLPASALNIPRQ